MFSHFCTGTITCPDNILFLPQKAYMVLGTLRDQIIYPHTRDQNTPSDHDISELLRRANLDYLLGRFHLDSVEIWNSVLSPGMLKKR